MKAYPTSCRPALSGWTVMLMAASVCLAIIARPARGAEKSRESAEKLQATGKVLF